MKKGDILSILLSTAVLVLPKYRKEFQFGADQLASICRQEQIDQQRRVPESTFQQSVADCITPAFACGYFCVGEAVFALSFEKHIEDKMLRFSPLDDISTSEVTEMSEGWY